MANEPSNIFRKSVCDICGEVEWKPYIGTREFNGGYTTVTQFEKSDFMRVNVGEHFWTVCPKCGDSIFDRINDLIEIKKVRCVQG